VTRLCLASPPWPSLQGEALKPFEEALARALSAGDVASLLLEAGETGKAPPQALLAPLRDQAQAAGAAFLLSGHPDLAARSGCDGCELPAERDLFRRARGLLGAEAIIGVACGASRHAAMSAGEWGADYVAFDAAAPEIEELLSWWQETMILPCVAREVGSLEQALALARAGADFIALAPSLWSHEGGAAALVTAFAAAADEHA
jgi:thiamine-phosphate pyrophosphorylase